VAISVTKFPPSIGAGKAWNRTLRAMSALPGVRMAFLEPGTLRARKHRPDVWLYEGHFGPIPVREPSVALLHEAPWTDPHLASMLSPAWVQRLGPPSQRSAETATLIVTPSASSAGQIAASSGVDPGRIRVVPHGVDPLIFHPARQAAGRAIVAEAGGADRPYVLLVSTMHRRKNIGALRQAMADLADRGFPHSLVLVLSPSPDETDGTDPRSSEHTSIVGHPGRSIVLRDLTELQLASVMSAAAAYCQPSLMEGFGLPTLESLACGVPVVVADRGSLPEVVGDAGLVVEPTPAALGQALGRLLAEPAVAATFGAAGRARSARFTWDATARGWLEVLGQASSQPPAGRRGPGARGGRSADGTATGARGPQPSSGGQLVPR
jgi:glycosyltransferase involved in cell wall biosynthesis